MVEREVEVTWEGRIAFRAKADDKWIAANTRVRKKLTYAMKIASVDSVRADMIGWLARDRAIDEGQRQREISGLGQDLPTDSADELIWSPEPESTDAESSRQWREARDALPPLGDAIVDSLRRWSGSRRGAYAACPAVDILACSSSEQFFRWFGCWPC